MRKMLTVFGVLLLLFLPVGVLAQEAYVERILDSRTGEGTMTFYYDNYKSSRHGTIFNLNSGSEIPGWTPQEPNYMPMRRIMKEIWATVYAVNFDPSFINYHPKSTFAWFAIYDFSVIFAYISMEGLDNLDTSEVKNMAEMFCNFNLQDIDLSHFDTSSCTDMHNMFSSAQFSSLDVSNFDTSKCTDMSGMFSGCRFLTSLDVSNFDTSNCSDMTDMFANCSKLQSLSISATMTNLPDGACSGIGKNNPCTIIAPEGFDFGVDTSGNSFTWKGGIFKLNQTVENQTVVLDENDEDLPEETTEKVNVKVKRTIKKTAVNTLCLPFDMSPSQLAEVFGDDCYLLELSVGNYTWTEGPDGDYQYQTNIIFEQTSNGLSAGHPYILITNKDMTEFNVRDVKIKTTQYYRIAELQSMYGEVGEIKNHGVLKNIGLLPVGSLFLKDDNYYLSDGTATIKGFRGYFEVTFFEEEDFSNMSFSLDLGELGNELNIDQLDFNGKTYNFGKVYSINGTYLGLAEKVMDKLPRGIYIINNKKVVVK